MTPRPKSAIPTNTPLVRLNLFAAHLLVGIRDFAEKPPPAVYLSGRRFCFSQRHTTKRPRRSPGVEPDADAVRRN